MSVVGVILAGGSGSRLGQVRKATLRIGGQSLIERVVARLEDLEPPILISTGRDTHSFGEFGTSVPDLDLPLAGPLAGLMAAAHNLAGQVDPATIVISVAVDTPFLPVDYAPRLLAALNSGAAAAHAGWKDNFYPTNAAWRLSDLANLEVGEHNSPRSLLRALGAIHVDWSDTHELDPFANLNGLDDLIGLTKRAGAHE